MVAGYWSNICQPHGCPVSWFPGRASGGGRSLVMHQAGEVKDVVTRFALWPVFPRIPNISARVGSSIV